MSWMLDNWQIKLVALFLAVALWFYTSGQARTERTFTVRIDERSVRVPEGLRVVRVEPEEFTVDVDGPLTVLRDIRSPALAPRLEVDPAAVADGRQRFPVASHVLGLPADVRVQRVLPAIDAISVVVDRVVTEAILVETPTVVRLPEGLALEAAQLEVDQATVTGPQVAVAELVRQRRLRFRPLSLDAVDPRLDRPQTLRLPLMPDVPPTVAVTPVFAKVTVRPVDAVRQKVDLPLHLLATPEFLRKHVVELGQPQVVVSVRGPRNLVASLEPGALTALVNLRRTMELNRPLEVPVEVLAPPWATVEPVTVRVTVSVATGRAEPAPSALGVPGE